MESGLWKRRIRRIRVRRADHFESGVARAVQSVGVRSFFRNRIQIQGQHNQRLLYILRTRTNYSRFTREPDRRRREYPQCGQSVPHRKSGDCGRNRIRRTSRGLRDNVDKHRRNRYSQYGNQRGRRAIQSLLLCPSVYRDLVFDGSRRADGGRRFANSLGGIREERSPVYRGDSVKARLQFRQFRGLHSGGRNCRIDDQRH